MIRRHARDFEEERVHELREQRGAVTVPRPTKEQKAAEDAQVRLLEAALLGRMTESSGSIATSA